jgi:uncharacterized protein (TIGR00661 family)
MRILYGVVGEGMGHAIRSRVILDHLVAEGHDVEVMASGRAQGFLAARFEGVHAIHGLHIIAEDNIVRRGKTLLSNVVAGAAGIPQNIEAYFQLIERFEPQVVISDFESWTYLFAKAHRLPVFSVDNMQVINRCEHPPEILQGVEADFEVAKAFVKAKLPWCDHYLIASFFSPTIRKDRTSLFPPILRPEILAAKAERGDHLLVYQTAEGHQELARTLQTLGIECRVYGMHRGLEQERVEGNLRHRPFSEEGFIEDLATARAVIAGGGFTLMGEAVYLHKPMLSVPMGHQFEQVLNGRWLQRLGYGRCTPTLDDPAVIASFLEAVPDCERALQAHTQEGNRALLAALDGHLDRAAAGLY